MQPSRTLPFALLIAVAALSGACSLMPRDPSFATLSGTISYREPVMLHPEDVVVVQLIDQSQSTRHDDVIAEERIERPKQLPIRFDLRYDDRAIVKGHQYAVTASIFAGQHLAFTMPAAQTVGFGSEAPRVELVLEQQGAPARKDSFQLQN